MNEKKTRAGSDRNDAVAMVVGIAAAAFILAIIFLLMSGGITPALVLWSSASIAISAYGGGIVYIIASLVRGY